MPTGDAGRRLSSMGPGVPTRTLSVAQTPRHSARAWHPSWGWVGGRARRGRALSVSERRPPSEWTQLRLVDSGYQPDSGFDKTHFNLGTFKKLSGTLTEPLWLAPSDSGRSESRASGSSCRR
jgi:hypothetical protein